MTSIHTPAMNEEMLEQLARRRAGSKLGWALHATAYVLVNLLLAALSVQQGRHWAIYPALGWGLGLLLHGAAVWLHLARSGPYAWLLARERERLQRGPH